MPAFEEHARLSRSRLWQLQRNYFDRHGIRAWSEAVVPHYITSNPWIAGAYAQVVVGWLRDCAATGLIPGQPVYIVELGCGSGRFGYLFLNRLLDILRRSSLRTPVRYIYTDFTEYNLDILRSHPSLQPFVEAGLLDFARFDLDSDRELRLSHSGEVLGAGTVANPMVVLANYVFDGVPQDCFRVRNGELYESLVGVEAAVEPDADTPDPEDPEWIARVSLSYQNRLIGRDYYDDPAWNRILETYRERLDNTTILFPCTALQGIRNLRELSGGRLLLLTGDKGHVHEESLAGRTEPELSVHGSFSLMVNYHAIGQFVMEAGGEFLHTTHGQAGLNIVACLFGEPMASGAYCETRLAFHDAIENRGPDDFFTLKRGVEKTLDSFTLEQAIAYVRLSGWDHRIFLGCLGVLIRQAEAASPAELADLKLLARCVWETYFPLREPEDLPFDLGLLSMATGCSPEALEFFGHSVRLYGPAAATALNMALCHLSLGERDLAMTRVDEALELDAELEEAHVLKSEIERLK